MQCVNSLPLGEGVVLTLCCPILSRRIWAKYILFAARLDLLKPKQNVYSLTVCNLYQYLPNGSEKSGFLSSDSMLKHFFLNRLFILKYD